MMELSLSVRNWKCYAIQSQCLPAAAKAERHRRKWYHRLHGSVQFSHSVMSDSLQPHGLQHSRLPFPSPTPRACSNSCPSSQWCHSTLSSSVIPFLLLPSVFLSIRVFFQWVSSLHQVANVLELQLQHQPFQWNSWLISSRIDWFDLLAVQRTLKSLLQHHSSKAMVLQCSAFFMVQLSYPYMSTGGKKGSPSR